MPQLHWLNEPTRWSHPTEDSLTLQVTPRTDFWRETHYGFTVDDGPYAYLNVGGEFVAEVRISGDYQTRFDQMGLMVRRDERTWNKTGVEFVDVLSLHQVSSRL